MKRHAGIALIAVGIVLSVLAGSQGVLAADPAPSPAPPQTAPFTDIQKAQIQDIVKNYLDNHGDVIISAAKNWQDKQEQQANASASANLKKDHDMLYNNASDPVAGNPKGDVTIVQFYDYNCHYCKGAAPFLTTLLHDDKNVRVVYKQFPILGPMSMMAAQAALAAQKQGKFIEFHDAMMSNTQPLSEERVLEIAKGIKGLDVKKMKDDANSDAITEEIKASLSLGEEVGVRGTPGFIVADQLHPGMLDLNQFKEIIAKARKNEKG